MGRDRRTRRGMRRALVMGLGCSLLGTVGLLSTPTSAAAPSESLEWAECAPTHGAGPQTRCATLLVPRDYAQPNGPTIEITVSRIAARDPDRRRGVLIGNPGGPGGDAISMFTYLSPPAAIADEWDLVAVQPRGLIGSTPVTCDPLTNSPETFVATGAALRDNCERHTPGYTRTLTTENTARDIDRARQALGVPKVSLYGISYGTILMGSYARMFPQHTDRLVLDSGVDPDWMWNALLAEQTPGYKRRVNDLMAWIAGNDNVYHLGATPLAVYRHWSAQIVAEAGVPPSLAGPPAEVGDVPPGLREVAKQYIAGVNMTADARARAGNLLATVLNPVSVQSNSSLLGLTRAAAPDRNSWPILAQRMAGRLPAAVPPSPEDVEAIRVSTSLQQLLLCNENGVPAQPADIPASVFANYVVGDIFDGPGLIYRSGMACAGAPSVVAPATISAAGLSVRPLQIQSSGDPQTPYAGSRNMQRIMGSHLITVGGGDHGHLGRANPTLDTALVEYLRTGRTSVTSTPEPAISTPLNYAGVPGGPSGMGGPR